MTLSAATQAACKEIQDKYSCCDVSLPFSLPKDRNQTDRSKVADALLVLKCPSAGSLADIFPLPSTDDNNNKKTRNPTRLVAPLSTVLFVPKTHEADPTWLTGDVETTIPQHSNLPADKHWTDIPAPGSIALLQQPSGQICALLGDIVATRLKARGIAGSIVDGRTRDIVGCNELCADGNFRVWVRGFATAGTGLEAKPWAVDVPLRVGGVAVRPGDFAVVDEAESGIVVIPKEKLREVVELLPKLKEADDAVLEDARGGLGLKEAFGKYPGHYTNRSSS
ncbi:hypothetical protein Q7P37_008019 [Cladosporium fusiforme]